MQLWRALFDLLDGANAEKVQGLIVDVRCLPDIEEEGDLRPRLNINFILLLYLQLVKLLCQ